MSNRKFYYDENKTAKFHFGDKEVLEIHELAQKTSNLLSDVDFIIINEDEAMFLEYKNSKVKGTGNPKALSEKVKREDFANSIARKYLDSLLIFMLLDKPKDSMKNYILLLEGKLIGKVERKNIRDRVAKKLPKLGEGVLTGFYVFDTREWRSKYSSSEYYIELTSKK